MAARLLEWVHRNQQKNKPTVEMRRRDTKQGERWNWQTTRKRFGTDYTEQENKHTSNVHHEREFQVGKQTSKDKQKKPLAQGILPVQWVPRVPRVQCQLCLWHKIKFLQDLHLLEAWECKHWATLIRLVLAFPCNLVPWHLDLDVLSPLHFSSFLFTPLPVFPPRPGVGDTSTSSIER